MPSQKKYQTLNRSFARRISKQLSQEKKDLLANDLPLYLYSSDKVKNHNYNKVFLEIGFGMGEHFIRQVQDNPDNLFIGIEVYLNGVAAGLKKFKESNCTNFLIWPDDLDLVLQTMPNTSLDGIYILFPDPWPKKRQNKKRLLNEIRLQSLKEKLKKDGFIIFASDIDDYFNSSYELLKNDQDFKITSNDFTIPYKGYIHTKYHQKAINEGRTAKFLQAVLS